MQRIENNYVTVNLIFRSNDKLTNARLFAFLSEVYIYLHYIYAIDNLLLFI